MPLLGPLQKLQMSLSPAGELTVLPKSLWIWGVTSRREEEGEREGRGTKKEGNWRKDARKHVYPLPPNKLLFTTFGNAPAAAQQQWSGQ